MIPKNDRTQKFHLTALTFSTKWQQQVCTQESIVIWLVLLGNSLIDQGLMDFKCSVTVLVLRARKLNAGSWKKAMFVTNKPHGNHLSLTVWSHTVLVHLDSNCEDKPLLAHTVRCVHSYQKLDLTDKALTIKCSLSEACSHLGSPKSTLKKWIKKVRSKSNSMSSSSIKTK